METKGQIQSKTNWFALALIIVSQLAEILKDQVVIDFLGSNIGWIGTTIGIIIFVLRQYTKIGVVWGGDKSNLEVLDEPSQSDDDYTKNF